jgi:ribosomal protein S18 acetylase RimI-like enzyme
VIPPRIRTATIADTVDVAALIGEAFHSLDVAAWLVPDPSQRSKILPADFQIFVEHALTYGEIDIIDDDIHDENDGPDAVAVWFHHESESAPMPAPADYDNRLDTACGAHADRFRILDGLFADHHPHIFPHHHLGMLATRPRHHNNGLGTTLLKHHHELLDRKGVAAYLEASSERSRSLYERHGYQLVGEHVQLPAETPMWPMWRESDT